MGKKPETILRVGLIYVNFGVSGVANLVHVIISNQFEQ